MSSFYNSFWKMYIKAINDLDPGLDLLEYNINILVTYIAPFVKCYLKVLLP